MLQNALRTPADNAWGPATDHNGAIVMQAADQKFPYGIEAAQKVVNTDQDGVWGPRSKAMLRETVISVQNALDHMGFNVHGSDGVWGKNTQDAYNEARKVCHI
jgi:hypothetical protein